MDHSGKLIADSARLRTQSKQCLDELKSGLKALRAEAKADPLFTMPDLRLRDRELLLELTRIVIHPKHSVPAHFFTMIHANTGEELGSINLRVASTPHIEFYAGHIGYGVHPAHRGHHYAARSVRLLLPLAKDLGLPSLWITCDPDNIPSRRSCELAGAEFVEIVDVPPHCMIFQTGHPRKCRYRILLNHKGHEDISG